ncbi:MAG: beta-ketoacyl synthase chain length factor [Chitinophagaceae bacterium]
MFYIHQTSCISPQQSFRDINLDELNVYSDQRLLAIEPGYNGIPPGVLRRMGKAVRMGVGAAMQTLQNKAAPNGIIMATANGGKEDCVKFLNQIIEYDEGLLTPINFVQSTPNAIAAQIGLLTGNHGYNITHLHLGLAFEFAVMDVVMLLEENPGNSYLLGAVDDISLYNYVFEEKDDLYKKEPLSAHLLYQTDSPGCVPGEGATMFLINGDQNGSLAKLVGVDTLHSEDPIAVKEKLQDFLRNYLPAGEVIDLLLSGENGDNRLLKYYTACESIIDEHVAIARFKHMSGEYPTAVAMGLWLCCHILQKQTIPDHMVKRATKTLYKNILIYNNFKGAQHSFMLVSIPT